MDLAVSCAVQGAFGLTGQACTGTSRAIVVKEALDEFTHKLVEATRRLKIGDGLSEGVKMGPVADAQQEKTILSYIEVGKQEGAELLYGGRKLGGDGYDRGYFIEPAVFGGVRPDMRIAQEEIFGPVLAVIKAKDIDDALAIANNTIYGLTGAFYSGDRERIERAKREFHVGNLYINRKCTGALVDVHPFGGFNMSGTDSKAGGRDYLGLFLQAKSVAEKL
jgi:1-pyrroline-5-carboxylate dehydrogenase